MPSVGVSPTIWNNDDVRDWAPEVPFPAILDEIVAADYAGTELGGNFPSEPEELRVALRGRGLALCGAYRWLHLLEDSTLSDELPDLDRLLGLLAAMGCRSLVVANAMTEGRRALAGRVPSDGSAGLADGQWQTLAGNLESVARRAADHGIGTHYHNHAGSYVETPDEVERLLALTDPALVSLCFDVGHYAYGGGQPAAFVARHHARIGYVHLKDVDPAVLETARATGLSFLDALRAYVFSELGQGLAEVPRVVDTLLGAGYDGWIVVEQDTSRRPSTETARANRRFLRERCGI